MDIAIHAQTSTLPRLKKLVKVLKHFGLGRHKYTVFCSQAPKHDVEKLFDGLEVTIDSSLPGTYRLPPLDSNEPFQHIASKMTNGPWFLLKVGTVPVVQEWADMLEREYLFAEKLYLGTAVYLPKKYVDVSGVTRISSGEPFIMEAAVYPPNVLKLTKSNLFHKTTHHEVLCRAERFGNAHLSDLIQDANLDDNFRNVNIRSGVCVVSRLANDALLDELIGDIPPPVVVEKIVVKEAPEAPAPYELKVPTIKIMQKNLPTEAKTENLDSPTEAEAVTVEPKRVRGRPRKVFSA